MHTPGNKTPAVNMGLGINPEYLRGELIATSEENFTETLRNLNTRRTVTATNTDSRETNNCFSWMNCEW
jgi:hypothetical protein